jgi:acyl dehydratase
MPPIVLDSPQSLDQFEGREIGVSDWFRITQDRVHEFAEATEDRQWIHVDRERAARESPYGAPIAHGFLTLSLVGHLMKQVFEVRGARLVVNYGLNRVRFPAAVRANSEIRARLALRSSKRLADSVEAIFLVTVDVKYEEKPCCVAEWIVRYYL